jgi:hypothetical protein
VFCVQGKVSLNRSCIIFKSLPPRTKQILWHTPVAGQRPCNWPVILQPLLGNDLVNGMFLCSTRTQEKWDTVTEEVFYIRSDPLHYCERQGGKKFLGDISTGTSPSNLGDSEISDSKIWSRVLRESDPRAAVLASSILRPERAPQSGSNKANDVSLSLLQNVK